MKKVHQAALADAVSKVYRDSENQEFVVKLYKVGEVQHGAEYFTDDKQDAIATAGQMLVDATKLLELPSEADLVYLDEQADVMAAQYNKMDCATSKAVAQAAHWNDAMMFIEAQEPLQHSMYRINCFIAGHDVEGPWCVFNAVQFGKECANMALAGVGFSVEFK